MKICEYIDTDINNNPLIKAERKKACKEEINKLFGTGITVELSEDFKELQGGER